MILAVDFDGTIHDPTNREPGYKLGKPVPGAVESLTKLRDEGHTLIVHSVWASPAMEDWLRHFEVPFDDVTTKKPKADFYIDDRAIRFTTWPDVLAQLP